MDYTTENYLYVKTDGKNFPKKYLWPRLVVETVADIVKRRHEETCHSGSRRRGELLKKMVQMEDAFVDNACKTLI